MINLQDPIYNDENKAREHLEKLRWPHGTPDCPKCGSFESGKLLKGKSTRPGVYKCKDCHKPFSVTVGTLFERSHIPLSKWLLAVHLISASKKGMSAHQLHRMLDVTYKTAWFMAHRIRESMKPEKMPPMGGDGNTVEVDETYVGNAGGNLKGSRGFWHKEKVLSLVDRKTGEVRSFHIDEVDAKTILDITSKNIDADSVYMTDEGRQHWSAGDGFQEHKTVNHKRKEYVRGDAYTNTIEGFFSIFKRGMKGTYQHCGLQHLQRYLTEFDFRYTNRKVEDAERASIALKNIEGKRLTYRRINLH